MFSGSVIRKLAHSEEVFAANETYFALTLLMRGHVDVNAMSDAFDALLEAHPIFVGHLEQGSDGRYQIVAEDLLHPGIWIVSDDSGPGTGGMRLDQTVSLMNMRLKLGEGTAGLTLYVHHSLADAHHVFGLLEELFAYYTDLVTTGSIGDVTPQPAPESLEAVLEQRGITKKPRSGLERLFRAMFAYELPQSEPIVVDNPDDVQMIPVARCRFTEQETADLVEFGRARQLSLNSLVAAAILLAEWELRKTPHVPIPYLYPVDLRYFLSPPVSMTGSTNPQGVATYLADIGPETDIVDVAQGIVGAFRADLSEGVIQQSLLHFSLQYQGTPPGLPPMVLCTDAGEIPAVRTPEGVVLQDFQAEFHCPFSAPVDVYVCGTFGGRLFIEHHAHAPGPEKFLEAIQPILRAVPADDGWESE